MEKTTKAIEQAEQFKQPEVANAIDVVTAWSVPLFSFVLVVIGVLLLLKMKSEKQTLAVGLFITVVGLVGSLWLIVSQSGLG
ncbi:hypothetical protein [Metabacillus iocasae]|uniref:Surface polysaccharide O-acyltransferase-like enzyme n=1 Tax=Priestia iocasae TaxID=2291674 RepID=A0ABS2QTY0_9BACI|nr:hypothetical protein [Metabacillus iocasae]MBM7702387.1 surface polysaccharide O-acyltransferase-like enzyme [Metabacillus iocasae]